ncbi:MAG: hypothetical protein NDI61_08410 [Bdellovibrionaceae bacterium]|nr:hypothetical protein [Pseudobdellovibrionaceae bacterium]
MGSQHSIFTAAGLALMLSLGGCAGQKFGLAPESKTFGHKVEYNTEVDVLLVIDTSGSMAQHQEQLAAQIPDFVAALDRTRLDYRVAVTTMDMGNGGAKGRFVAGPGKAPAVLPFHYPDLSRVLSERVRLGELGGTVERGLQAMKAALTSPNLEYDNAGFLRKDSLLAVVFLSNEEDESVPDDYISFLDKLKPMLATGERSWISHFIGVLPNDKSCNSARWNYRDPGMKYMALAQASGGRSESICSADLHMAVDKIKSRIIEIVTEYSLGDRAANPETIKVYVNGQLLAEDSINGWTFNESRNSITFHGTGVPLPGSMIHVDFTPEGIK